MSEPIEITRDDRTTHGGYYADIPGATRPAELTWQSHNGVRFANHTYVPDEARGKGVAMSLVQALVDDARAEGFRIEPVCPYVVSAFRRHPEWDDVRAGS